ncbi:hypothetical protein V1478_010979 [Vespula squamosa]|uniref:Uncharacterized protein n=1 Tax=Vespula squamosa TaxID=30214 RepID=A0ABD2AFV9_VESSQ
MRVMSIDEIFGGNTFENLCYIESYEEPRRGATGMSPDELSSCLPATPIFSYRVTATLSIRHLEGGRRWNDEADTGDWLRGGSPTAYLGDTSTTNQATTAHRLITIVIKTIANTSLH